MAEPALKLAPEQKSNPADQPAAATAAAPTQKKRSAWRRYRRPLLLVVLPLVALIGGVVFYLSGGRYVTTDDAYVGAQKVLITPDISGKIDKVVVKEGQQVKQGDVLFEIDPVPFRLALDGFSVAETHRLVEQLETIKDNIRQALQTAGGTTKIKESRYG